MASLERLPLASADVPDAPSGNGIEVYQLGVRLLLNPALGHGLGYGGYLWPAAFALGVCLEELSHQQSFEKLKILELGAGSGLVGLVAARLGAAVTLTDSEHVLPHLQSNISANPELGPRVQVSSVHFGSDIRTLSATDRFDIIVGSDITYTKDLQEALIVTLLQLVQHNTLIMLSHTQRDSDVTKNLWGIMGEYFYVEEVSVADESAQKWVEYRILADSLLEEFECGDFTRHDERYSMLLVRAKLRQDLRFPVEQIAEKMVLKWAGVLQYPLLSRDVCVRIQCKPSILVWEADLLLVAHLERSACEWCEKQVLELGAQSGLPGITAACMGAQVTILTFSHSKPHLLRNVSLNEESIASAHGGIRIFESSPLDNALKDLYDCKYDLIIASSNSYGGHLRSDIFAVLAKLVRLGVGILLAQSSHSLVDSIKDFPEFRQPSASFTTAVVETGESVQDVRSDLPEILVSSRINEFYNEGFTGKTFVSQVQVSTTEVRESIDEAALQT